MHNFSKEFSLKSDAEFTFHEITKEKYAKRLFHKQEITNNLMFSNKGF